MGPNAPRDAGELGYEFYVRLVPILRFTTLLWRLRLLAPIRFAAWMDRFER